MCGADWQKSTERTCRVCAKAWQGGGEDTFWRERALKRHKTAQVRPSWCLGNSGDDLMQFKTLTMTGCAALALTACASGGGEGPARDPIRAILSGDAMMFVSFDTNGDLSVSRDELEAGIAREFTRIDANADGNVSPIEFQNWANNVLGGGQMGPYRLDFDRNVDNTITRAEFETEVRGRFSDYDENSDGALTRSEFVRLVGAARTPTQRREPMQPMR
jgi:hypothetical protein